MAATVQEGSRAFFATLNEQALGEVVASTNTAGKSFENSIQDNLLLVAIHAQYHHGKVNRLKLPVAGTVEPVTFARMSLLFIAVALAASYLPARRASATDPMAVLRGK